jgi:RND family efflux transporter MFP subunit
MARRHAVGLSAFVALIVVAATAVSNAEEFTVETITIPTTKAVFAQVMSRTIVPARARIGGTIRAIHVSEGDEVTRNEVVARVVDEKIALEIEAARARIEALRSQLQNARTELERVEQLVSRGAAAQSRLDQVQTQFDVVTNQIVAAESELSVISQRAREGEVFAPNSGRVLSVPVTEGSVILPGEEIARIASGRYFLRLSIPERHASRIEVGATVSVAGRGPEPQKNSSEKFGRIVKVYPEISGGRIMADVEVDGLGDYFVNERTLVHVPVGERLAVAVPANAISTRHGIDYLSLATEQGEQDIAVIAGDRIRQGEGNLVEILSGLREGDRVIVQ